MEEDERARLHRELDAILDLRDGVTPFRSLRDLIEPEVDQDSKRRRFAWSIFQRAVSLARDAIGNDLRHAALGSSDGNPASDRSALRRAIALVGRLIEPPPRLPIESMPALRPYQIIEAIEALDCGEQRPLFEPAKPKRGWRPNRYTIAKCRLEALCWEQRFQARGQSQVEARAKVARAFGYNWDTIRTWQKGCAEVLGEFTVEFSLEDARKMASWPKIPGQDQLPDEATEMRVWEAQLARAADALRKAMVDAGKSPKARLPDK